MHHLLLSTSFAAFVLLPAYPGWAQVTPDGTLGTSVSQMELDFTITGGTRPNHGSNLFHSFSQFSVPTGGSASFNNAADVVNILGRVTGGSVSKIDGIIRAQGGTNLFLINPAGILFGPNASLNIGGSFIGSTANSIKFADGSEFSTSNLASSSLLTISVPIGLQMGSNSGDITVQNSGHRFSSVPFSNSPLKFNSTPSGLQVSPGNTLALVGGNINLDGGILTAPGGRLDLGAVQPTPTALVGLRSEGSRWAIDYGAISQFGDINLRQQALVNTSGTGNGAIQIQARNLIAQDGSAMVWENRGSQAGSGITIRTSDTVQLLRRSSNGFGSGIYSDATSTGSTGDITVTTGQLLMQSGTTISSRTFTSAVGGNISISATASQLFSSDSTPSMIATRALGSGQGGSLTVNAQRLSIQGSGGLVSTVNNAAGNGGSLTINVRDSIDLISSGDGIGGQALFSASAVGGTGNAGNLTVNTGRLTLRNGAVISSSTFGAGNGGGVMVNASEAISMAGSRTDSLGGFVRSGIRAAGILLPSTNRAFFGLPDTVTGAAGNVVINTPQLRIADGAEVSVGHNDRGNAGNLFINVGRLTLDNRGRITASTVSGEGGDITLTLQKGLILRRGSFISTEAQGTGSGGNITIKSPVVVGFENSDIIANAVRGRGGNIQITTQGIYGLKFRPQLTLENDITASSRFGVNGTVQITTPGVAPDSGLVPLSTKFTDPSQQITTGCAGNNGSSFIATGRGGIPENPTQEVMSDRPWQDLRDPSQYQALSRASAQVPLSTSNPLLVEASRLNRINGQLELVAINSSVPLPQAATCARAIGSAP